MATGIANVKGKIGGASLYETVVAPTDLGGGTAYSLETSATGETAKNDDVIAYVDNGSISALFKVTGVLESTYVLTKIGDIGGGKQLYRHTITIGETDGSTYKIKVSFAIDTDRSTSYDYTSLKQWLMTKGYVNTIDTFKTTRKWTMANGRSNLNGSDVQVIGVWVAETYERLNFTVIGSDILYNRYQLGGSFTFDDFVRPL